ncbi:MAG: hypothetical protein SVY15_06100 [Halobacteriota archaeon]|nr:hypothetical protein [Halobacteriota archaeon]
MKNILKKVVTVLMLISMIGLITACLDSTEAKVSMSVTPSSKTIKSGDYATYKISVENREDVAVRPIVKIEPLNSEDSIYITIPDDTIDKGMIKAGAGWTEPIQITAELIGDSVTYPLLVKMSINGEEIREQEIKLTVIS